MISFLVLNDASKAPNTRCRQGLLFLVPAHSLEAPQRIERLERPPALDFPLQIHVAGIIQQLRSENTLAVPVKEIIAIKHEVAGLRA